MHRTRTSRNINMAANWRKILEEHAILQPLVKYQERLSSITECKEWVVIRDGEMFLWNRNTGSVLTTNLKYSKLDLKVDSGRNTVHHVYKTLSLSIPPVEEVDRMLLSPGGRYLALVTKNELVIVKLPSQWDEQGPQDGRNPVMCKCISVAEHLLKTSAVCLVDVAWHPGSLDDSHISLLTADNYIRLRWAQGNSAVGFDFGSPVDMETKSKSSQRAVDVIKLWPIYVLFGNGDVFKVISRIESICFQKFNVEGPLKVYPAAENANRNDACGILCLAGEPTILILANRDGRIDHCVVLDGENNKDVDESELESFRHLTLTTTPTSSLYIYETVQLELSLTSSLNDDSIEEPFICTMRLYRDTSQKNRYLCMHNAGLHAVVLSWFYKVLEFSQSEMETDLAQLLENSPSLVEHLVCTKPSTCSEEAPLLGVAAMKYDLQRALIVLTIAPEFIVLPLRNCVKKSPPPKLLSESHLTSPMKRIMREPFDERISRVLQRSSSYPVIKAVKDVELNGEDCFMLLSQAIQMLRQEHLLKLDITRREIQKRLELHHEMKATQENDLKQLQQTKDVLREQARLLAEKYEAANENQTTLLHRLETVLRKLSANFPMMSVAEENMYKELKQMKDNLKCVEDSVSQLKTKQEYQQKMFLQDKQKKKRTSAPLVSTNHQRTLRNLLKDQGEEISDLVKKVSQLQSSLEV
ncbi:hypothetical protein LSH36_474g04037 [Paralvinella palmiformis]|uniref:Nuclear pore complex protein Nup88 n=1 Tax=Paralvinella palmiformis TaxID=53620 RepID=A0AAD9JAM3_9ANNE|nr:hypothetical protein LSH36_474g04037 [Paralvinella palmiformis]